MRSDPVRGGRSAANPAGLPHGGSAASISWAGCSSLPALVFYTLFVLQPLVLSGPVLALRWNGIGVATWVGLDELRGRCSATTSCSSSLFNAFRLVVFFSFIPVTLGLVTASVIRRVACGSPRDDLPDGPVPAPGHPARGSRASSGTGCCPVNGPHQPAPDGGRSRRHHQGLARRLRHGTRRRRDHRHLGPPRFCTTLLLLTGMSKIDPALYESARLDGAGSFQEFRAITVPERPERGCRLRSR